MEYEKPIDEARADEPDRLTATRPQYRLHDFRRPHLLAEGDLRALESLFGKFARAASTGLSALARARVQVDLTGIAQKSYSEFSRSLPNPTGLYLVYHLPEGLPFVLEMSPTVLYPLIERLLGGKGQPSAPTNRPPTRIEQALGKTIAAQVLNALESSWAAALGSPQRASGVPDPAETDSPLRLDLAETEHNPLLMQMVGPSEPALVLSFQAAMGLAGALSGPLHLCLPIHAFEPLIARLVHATSPGARSDQQSQAERERILAAVVTTPVELTAELAELPVALNDILALRPGDVLDLGIGKEANAAVLVDGRKTFQGQAVNRDGQRTLRITPTAASSEPCPAGPAKN